MISVIHISGYVAVTEINSKYKHQEKTAITVMKTEKTTHRRFDLGVGGKNRENSVEKRIVFDFSFEVTNAVFNKCLPSWSIQKGLKFANRLEGTIIENSAEYRIIGYS